MKHSTQYMVGNANTVVVSPAGNSSTNLVYACHKKAKELSICYSNVYCSCTHTLTHTHTPLNNTMIVTRVALVTPLNEPGLN